MKLRRRTGCDPLLLAVNDVEVAALGLLRRRLEAADVGTRVGLRDRETNRFLTA